MRRGMIHEHEEMLEDHLSAMRRAVMKDSVTLHEAREILHISIGGDKSEKSYGRLVTTDGTVVEETSFRFMPDFGYQVGAGVSFAGGYQILLRYVDLGTPRYEGTQVLNEKYFTTIPRKENAINGDPRRVSMFLIALGYTL